MDQHCTRIDLGNRLELPAQRGEGSLDAEVAAGQSAGLGPGSPGSSSILFL